MIGAGIMLYPAIEDTVNSADEHFFYDRSEDVFYDADGIAYQYRFDKTGFDYLYDETGTAYDADLCYLTEDGYLFYDKRMNITMAKEDFCVNPAGEHFYPVSETIVREDGSLDYQNDYVIPCYDREGNAYHYDNVPFYNIDGDKYYFSIESGETEGVFTNLNNGEKIPGSSAYVDKNGYLYNLDGTGLSAVGKGRCCSADGTVYFKATGVEWGKNGKLNYIGLED